VKLKNLILLTAFLLVGAVGLRFQRAGEAVSSPPGMVWIPGGEFTMGTDEAEAYRVERPAHRVAVTGFWMDEHEVTNAEFRTFVEATGYVTTAERKPEWEELKKQLPPGTPKPDEAMLVPRSLVFTPPAHPVSLQDASAWWMWTPGAN
jgi:sulfatase modifying factor 1